MARVARAPVKARVLVGWFARSVEGGAGGMSPRINTAADALQEPLPILTEHLGEGRRRKARGKRDDVGVRAPAAGAEEPSPGAEC